MDRIHLNLEKVSTETILSFLAPKNRGRLVGISHQVPEPFSRAEGMRSTSNCRVLMPVVVTNVPKDEILIIHFNEVLPLGEGTLVIEFQGTLNDKMKGFYRSVYELNGEKKNMAVTNFEPADARRCFPCWDEPSFKAVFKITLEVPLETVALSNMPVVEEKVNGASKSVYFEETPIMSTYLVAVIVGMFDYAEAFTTDGIRVRVYTQVGKSNQGKFALEVAVKALVLFKEYFDVPYPLPKLDMVAIPDFASGAMENYGLVTYRETYLLFDERQSAASNKQKVAIAVSHELAHQWFGNLVTMEWWTHLWLNEGFATWVSYLAADHFFPDWNFWTQFLEESTTGFKLDALAGSHPIEELDNGLEAIPPMYVEDSEYNGVEISTTFACYHGLQPARRVAWDGVHAGRRFLGCPYEDEDECNFVAWVDGQWPHRVRRTIERLWRTVDRATERSQAQVSRWYELHKEKLLAEEEKNKAISMVLALERKRKTQVERMEVSLRRKRRLLLLSNVMIALLLIILSYVIAVKD